MRGNLAWAEEAGMDIREVTGESYTRLFGEGYSLDSCPVSETLSTQKGAEGEAMTAQGKVFKLSTFFMGDEIVGKDAGNRVVCHYKDITDEKSMQAQLIQSEKLAAVGQLAGGVAHEINNPLSAILAFSQLGVRDVEPGTEIHEFLTEIEEAAQRCKEIVQNLLTFSRAPQRSDRRIAELEQVVAKAVGLLRHEFDRKNVSLEIRHGESELLFQGVANQMIQVVVNLLGNALHAAGQGGTVRVETRKVGDELVLDVEDSGAGIPADAMEKLFEPFFTTKEEGQGTGLGLSVSYGIVQEHSGSIFAENQESGGARFTVRLPSA